MALFDVSLQCSETTAIGGSANVVAVIPRRRVIDSLCGLVDEGIMRIISS